MFLRTEQTAKLSILGQSSLRQSGRGIDNVLRPAQDIEVAIDVTFSQVVQAGGNEVAQGSRPRQADRDLRVGSEVMLQPIPQGQAKRHISLEPQATEQSAQ